MNREFVYSAAPNLSKRVVLGMLALTVLLVNSAAQADAIVLAKGGESNYRIVVPENADLSTWAAALDLANVLDEMTGAVFPVSTDVSTLPVAEYEIILGGENRHIAAIGAAIEPVPVDAYEIRTHGNHIIIAGGKGRGTLNGIYGFAQDHLGCRWLTPGCQYIPQKNELSLGEIRDRQIPAFRWRSTDSAMQWDADWYIRNRFNESKARVGGPRPSAIMQLEGDIRALTMANSWNPHAFQDIPPALHAEHPEWFAEVKGERKLADSPVHQAYCLTNPEFAGWVSDWTRDRVAANPNIQFISITQADNSQNCECATCVEAYKTVGASGISVTFANRVAERLGKEFPEVSIITFAYLGTFAPNPVVALPNVRVIWAPINADIAHPLNEGEINLGQDYIGQLSTWLANTTQLGIWYYQFDSNAPIPRPGMRALQSNLRMFQELGVDQMFIEMNFDPAQKDGEGDGDLSVPAYMNSRDYYGRKTPYHTIVFPFGFDHLRGYQIARLLWNPALNLDELTREFCDLYYGTAADEIAGCVMTIESLDSYDRTLERDFIGAKGIYMHFSHSPRIKADVLQELDVRLERAQKSVEGDKTLSQRVAMARMGIDLAILAYGTTDAPLKQAAFDRFFAQAEAIGLASHLSVPGVGGKSIAELKAHFAEQLQ